MAIETGRSAPDFTLPDQNKNPVTLGSFKGERKVVLVFYPFTFTGICESEVCALRDEFAELAELDATVLAVSVDSVHVHRRWAEEQGIEYPLLADFWPHGEVARAYGVFNEDLGAAERGTFIIDKEGTVRFTEHNPVGERRNVEGYAEVLRGL
ncbi:MAG: peroxiredoxin [Actinobacteria bacterium ATB1]|nr:peroxiredoxin [Actinobacteria bacterium ATB1]